MTPPKQNAQTIAKLNELYITTRRKYLVQTADSYITLDRANSDRIWTLNDSMLALHLSGGTTYGIFNAGGANKFITFDVDYSDDMPMARWASAKLIDVLINDFHIARADIHVSESGGKGYHVDLFFDKPLSADTAHRFYQNVINAAELPPNKVEFRPTWTQGVKLPLGIHQKTGRRCWFVDNETFAPVESYDYLDGVEPMDAALIVDGAIELTQEQEAEFREIVKRTDVSKTTVTATQSMRKAARILKAGRLTASGTRNDTTHLLAKFFYSQGVDEADAIEQIMDVLLNTPREYFDKKSTPEHWRKETERLVYDAYRKGYTLGNADKEITIYKSEILAVLGVGTFRQKQLAYAMLVASKRFGDVFYLTMNTAMEMLGTKSRDTVNNGIKKLVAVGFMEYRRKAEVDKARSHELGRLVHKPNLYSLLIDKPAADEKSVTVKPDKSMMEVAHMLCDKSELKRVISRWEFDSRWKRA